MTFPIAPNTIQMNTFHFSESERFSLLFSVREYMRGSCCLYRFFLIAGWKKGPLNFFPLSNPTSLFVNILNLLWNGMGCGGNRNGAVWEGLLQLKGENHLQFFKFLQLNWKTQGVNFMILEDLDPIFNNFKNINRISRICRHASFPICYFSRFWHFHIHICLKWFRFLVCWSDSAEPKSRLMVSGIGDISNNPKKHANHNS